MSAECRMMNDEFLPARRRRAVHASLVAHCSSFTLIEMLTVIAIIGILAAILLPTLQTVRREAQKTQAKNDVATIAQALASYSADFGAFPPDSNASLDSRPDAFGDMNMPNECLVWFLTREYVKSGGAGVASDTEVSWPVSPKNAFQVNARISASGYLDVRTKSRRDYDNDEFYEFADPWGNPYFYRAWPDAWRDIEDADLDAGDSSILVLDLDLPTELQSMQGILGYIRLRDVGDNAFNGDFAFEGAHPDLVKIAFAAALGSAPDVSAPAQYRFLPHNRQTCDVYSLGPNGRTRGAANPKQSGATVEWKPQNTKYEIIAPDTVPQWQMIWGNPGDGNDVQKDGNFGITNEKDRDDINNW